MIVNDNDYRMSNNTIIYNNNKNRTSRRKSVTTTMKTTNNNNKIIHDGRRCFVVLRTGTPMPTTTVVVFFSLVLFMIVLSSGEAGNNNNYNNHYNNNNYHRRRRHNNNNNNNINDRNNPYDVLGVDRDATQEDIRQQYRKLCLKYHPDKNVQKSPKERQRCEELFKSIQKANSQIGDKDSRRQYDNDSLSRTTAFSSSYGAQQPYSQDPFFRAFSSSNPHQRHHPFFQHGNIRVFDLQDVFPAFFRQQQQQQQQPHFSPGMSRRPPWKSVYVQKVKVPLHRLYEGCNDMTFRLKDTIWNRYRAAFRGEIGYILLYQGLLVALPILRVSRILSFIVGMMIIHINLPRPYRTDYDVTLLPGYKQGTKFIYNNNINSNDNIDVIFMIQEQKHKYYTRVGNNLYTTILITRDQAKHGCKITIQPLQNQQPGKNKNDSNNNSNNNNNNNPLPARIYLKPDRIRQSGDQITLKGKGWPLRLPQKEQQSSTKSQRRQQQQQQQIYGDLIVQFIIKKNYWNPRIIGRNNNSNNNNNKNDNKSNNNYDKSNNNHNNDNYIQQRYRFDVNNTNNSNNRKKKRRRRKKRKQQGKRRLWKR